MKTVYAGPGRTVAPPAKPLPTRKENDVPPPMTPARRATADQVAAARDIDELLALLPTVKDRDPATIRICNCAACRKFLLAEAERAFHRTAPADAKALLPEPVAGRLFDRPYCMKCLKPDSGNRNYGLPPALPVAPSSGVLE